MTVYLELTESVSRFKGRFEGFWPRFSGAMNSSCCERRIARFLKIKGCFGWFFLFWFGVFLSHCRPQITRHASGCLGPCVSFQDTAMCG